MQLFELVKHLRRVDRAPHMDVSITAMSSDSRAVTPGTLFVALRGGGIQDRHRYIPRAIERGAAALLVEEWQPDCPVPQVVVPDIRVAVGILADAFYGYPSHELRVIGITGTNGKTTVSQLVDRVLTDAGHQTGVLGTLGRRIAGIPSETRNTTPEAIEYQASLRQMVDANCTYAVTEASSQALDLRRVAGTRYHAAVFTNLTQDHLDYHGTMEAYLGAKALLFSRLGNTYNGNPGDTPYGVLNADDPASSTLAKHAAVECLTYGIDHPADVLAADVTVRMDGLSFTTHTPVGQAHIEMNLTGRFNVYNALAAITVGLCEGIALEDIAASLAAIPGVPGRLERVLYPAEYTVLVDYSHTPDSLLNALSSARQFTTGRLICVVGCGGDRDKTKRPIMARVAAELSDVSIFTSDNPRSEDPEMILDDMVAGVDATSDHHKSYERIRDRKLAIQRAVLQAQPGDVVLIAGKGHETYQIIGSNTYHFDDREVAREAMASRSMPG